MLSWEYKLHIGTLFIYLFIFIPDSLKLKKYKQ